MSSIDMDILLQEIDDAPTVQAGLINLLVKIRWVIQEDGGDDQAMTALAGWLDENAAVLADAVINNTPARAAHEERATQIAEEADGVTAGDDPS